MLPSLVLFLALPVLIGQGYGFWLSLAVASALTFAADPAMTWALARAGIAL
ncbi:MAG TPA: hypothetical protein PLD46_01770 [Hyphomicrobium sp.]|nr:hypothetical protein [Hyphomicrobium sp.]